MDRFEEQDHRGWGWPADLDDDVSADEPMDLVDWLCLVACGLSFTWLGMSVVWAVTQRRIP